MHRFDSAFPDIDGFHQFYTEEIEPVLFEKEAKRKKGVQQYYVWMTASIVLGFMLAMYMSQRVDTFPSVLAGSVLGLLGTALAYASTLGELSKRTKTFLLPAICQFLGWVFQEEPLEQPDLEPWVGNRLLPKSYHRVKFEDRMHGMVRQTDFDMIECHMERKTRNKNGGDSWTTVFRGALITLTFKREFLGRTVVLRDGGWLQGKQKAGMKRVGLVDPVFEKIFEAYGTDQVEARYLLTPTFMQKLVDLETSVDGRRARFGFWDDRLCIAVETGNRFEAGSMFKPMNDPQRVQDILDEISSVYALVDAVADG